MLIELDTEDTGILQGTCSQNQIQRIQGYFRVHAHRARYGGYRDISEYMLIELDTEDTGILRNTCSQNQIQRIQGYFGVHAHRTRYSGYRDTKGYMLNAHRIRYRGCRDNLEYTLIESDTEDAGILWVHAHRSTYRGYLDTLRCICYRTRYRGCVDICLQNQMLCIITQNQIQWIQEYFTMLIELDTEDTGIVQIVCSVSKH